MSFILFFIIIKKRIGGVIMKKEGFTLTEVLGVIVIIGFLALLVTPAVSKTIKNNRQRLYEVQIKNIENAARDYAVKNTEILPESGKAIVITLGELKKGGFIEKEVRNPLTKELFSDDLKIQISNANNQYTYTVLEEIVNGVSQ